jgi:hypothetical protein
MDSAEKVLHQKRARILYDKDCPRIVLFFSGDIFNGPFHGSLFENRGFFSRITIDNRRVRMKQKPFNLKQKAETLTC